MNDNKYQMDLDDYISMEKHESLEKATIILNGKEQSAELRWNGQQVEVSFSDGTIINGIWTDDQLVDKEGFPVTYNPDDIAQSVSYASVEMSKEELSEALCRISRNEAESIGSVGIVIAGAFIYMMGIAMFLFPEQTYFLFGKWRYVNPELSYDGITVQKISGIVVSIVGVVVMSGLFVFLI